MSATAAPLASTSGWHARLELGFEQRADRTTLVHRTHTGPLMVQSPFYPGDGACHVYVLHPPGGVVAGDRLELEARTGPDTHVLITTPAANKLYRSDGRTASVEQHLRIGPRARCEWLPQETIAFPGARAATLTRIDLHPSARFIGWEYACIGLPARSERFTRGLWDQRLEVHCAGEPLLLERQRIAGSHPMLEAAWGMGGFPAMGTLWVHTGRGNRGGGDQSLTESLRARLDAFDAGVAAVTWVDGLTVCRALGRSVGLISRLWRQIWAEIRPAIMDAAPVAPPDLVHLTTAQLEEPSKMDLSPREKDKLLVFTAGLLAERRKARGLKLNYPEAIALISAAILEGARDGRTVAELMSYGTTLLSRDDVMEGIPEMIDEVQVEATFPDGTKLVTVHNPIA